MEKTCVYPGTFDPVTYGHIDVIERSLKLFDRVIVAVAAATGKECLFTAEERKFLVEAVFKHEPSVKVEIFRGLLVEFLRTQGISIVIRGLRAVSDFEYEFQMATTNRVIYPQVETVFLLPRTDFFYISSSLIREIARLKGDVSFFVPPVVEEALRRKLASTT